MYSAENAACFAGEPSHGRRATWASLMGARGNGGVAGRGTASRESLLGDPEGPVHRFRKVLEGLKGVFGPFCACFAGSPGRFGFLVRPSLTTAAVHPRRAHQPPPGRPPRAALAGRPGGDDNDLPRYSGPLRADNANGYARAEPPHADYFAAGRGGIATVGTMMWAYGTFPHHPRPTAMRIGRQRLRATSCPRRAP